MSVYGNSILNYKKDPYITAVNEAYVGKSENLLKIEEHIGNLRKVSIYSDINTSKDVLAINRLFEKQFGMNVFGLKVYKSDIVNAYTYVLATNFKIAANYDLNEEVEATAKDGYRFKQPNDFCIIVNMSSALLHNPEYTNGEILAVLLHEIGHNFADCLYDTIRLANQDMILQYKQALMYKIILEALSIVFIPMAIADIKEYNNLNKSAKSKSKKEKRQQKFKNPIKGLFSGIFSKVSNFTQYLGELLFRLSTNGDAYEKYIDKLATKGNVEKNKKSIGRQNEVFADKFAGVYGYGPEQASCLYKMTLERSKADIKADSENNDKINQAFMKIHKIDCHPQVVQRAREELKLLEREIKKEDIDPEVKKVIQSQILELNKIIDKMCEVNDKLSKDERLKNNYNKIVNQNDPDAIDDKIEEAIEQALDKLIEEDKKKNKK